MFNNQNIGNPDNLRRVQAETEFNTFSPQQQHIPDKPSALASHYMAVLTSAIRDADTDLPISYNWLEVTGSRGLGGNDNIKWLTTGYGSDTFARAYPTHQADWTHMIEYEADGSAEHPYTKVVFIKALSASDGTHYMIYDPCVEGFWARLTSMVPYANHPNWGYHWTMVRPHINIYSENEPSWEDMSITSLSDGFDVAFEVNGIAMPFKTDPASASIVWIKPGPSKDLSEGDNPGQMFLIYHTEGPCQDQANMTPLVGGVPNPSTAPNRDEWDKFTGFLPYGGTRSKRNPVDDKPYGGVQLYIVTSVSSCFVPRYRLFRWDAQGHMVYIGEEVEYAVTL